MVASYRRFNFPVGKFKPSALAELVGDLAGNLNLSRLVYDEEKVRR